jgi:hypothetical protein
MPDPVPCPKCGRLYVWDGTRCVNTYCRFGSAEKPLRPRKPRKKVAPVLPESFDARWQSVSPMGVAAVSELLEGLRQTKYGWSVPLPVESGNFLGAQLIVEFQTRPVPERRAPPGVNEGERELATKILLGLRGVLREAERRFESYNSDTPDAMGLVSKPHIWIDRDTIEAEGPGRWALVVGAKGAPDFGWHVVFEGIECREIWAGD